MKSGPLDKESGKKYFWAKTNIFLSGSSKGPLREILTLGGPKIPA
jgi:hypothetical protein